MAADDNAGTVSLGIRLEDEQFLKDIAKLSNEVSKHMQKAMSEGFSFNKQAVNIDMSGFTKEVTAAIKETTGAIDGLGDMVYQELSKGAQQGAEAVATYTKGAFNNITMPKVKVELDRAQLEQQLALYSQRWEAIDNQRIAQAKRVNAIRAELANTAEGTGAHVKLAEQLAQAEAKLNSLKIAAFQADAQVVQLERSLAGAGHTGASGGGMAKQMQEQLKESVAKTAAQAKKLGDTGKEAGKKISSGMKTANKATHGLGMSMKKALRIGLAFMGVRSIYYGIRRVVNAVTQEFKRMAEQNSVFAAQMNRLSAGVDQLKGSFASMVAPLLSALAPALEFIISKLTQAFNALTMFFGALAGKKTVMIAVGSTKQFTKGVDASAKSAGKAAKANEKLKRSLAGFDELEIIDTGKSAGSAGTAPKAGTIYKEVATGFGGLGNILGNIGDMLKDLFAKISNTKAWQILSDAASTAWDKIKTSASKAWDRIKKSWDRNSSRILDSWRNLGGSIADAWARVSSYVFILFVAGGFSAGLEIGGMIVDGILTSLATLSEFVESVFAPFFDSVSEFFDEYGPTISEKIYETWEFIKEAVGVVIDGIVLFVQEIFGGLTEWFREHGEEIKNVLTETWRTIWTVIEPIWNIILDVGRFIFGKLKGFFEEIFPKIRDAIVNAVDAAWKVIKPIWEAMLKVAQTIFGALKTFWDTWGADILGIFGRVWDIAQGIFGTAWDVISGIFKSFSKLFSGDFSDFWNGILETGKNLWNSLKTAFSDTMDAIVDVFSLLGLDLSGVWDSIKKIFDGIILFFRGIFLGDWASAWSGVLKVFDGIFSGIVELFKLPINVLIDGINWFIKQINSIKVPDWVPFVGGYGFDIGYIQHLAKGGVVEQPTLAMVGDAGKEAVMPLDRNTGWIDQLAAKIAEKGGTGGGDIHITQPIYLGSDTLIGVLETIIDREGRLRNEPVFG